jgi:GntR family transcriptional regulator / MocR family aminotransferase
MGQLKATGKQRRPRGTRAIYEALKAQIEDGVYKPAAELPSTRALAVEFGASRTTITAAYEQLLAEGFIETHQGRKARVSPALQADRAIRASPTPAPRTARLSAFGRRLTEFEAPAVAGEPLQIDFRYGDIAAADFPRLAWRRSLTKALAATGPRSLRYQDPQGSRELREALRAYLWRARSLSCDVDRIVIVIGSQQGLDLCARILLDAGDQFAIENPYYWAARHAFESTGATPRFIPVDEEGLRTDGLADLKNTRLCYVTPSHQFPLGHVLSASRRGQLLHWADKADAYVIEDDYDSEYRYDIRPIPPLQTLDAAGRVIYLGTISKTLSPLLRLGYLVVPPELVDVFRNAKRLTDRHSPAMEQAALADFMQTGSYERHVRRLRRKNAERRAALLEALADQFGDTVEVQGSDAGLHLVVWFNTIDVTREGDLAAHAKMRGLGVYPISGLYAEKPTALRRRSGFVFGYAALEEGEIRRGIARLAHTVRSL